MKEFEQLLDRIHAKVPRFQGLTINSDGSVLLTHGWGARYFASLAELAAKLDTLKFEE